MAAVDFGKEYSQNVHRVVILPEREASNLHCEPLRTDFRVEVANSVNDLLTESSPKMESYEPCILLDVDIEEGNGKFRKSSEESILHNDSLPRGLQRDLCYHFGGRIMQFLTNHIPQFPNSRERFVAERGFDNSGSKARKYKRSQSFNSRRVVLLFSVLSSVGTLVLILLTLRLWLMSGSRKF